MQDTGIYSVSKTSPRHFLRTSSKLVLKACLRRLQHNIFFLPKTSWKTNHFYAADVFKTSWKPVNFCWAAGCVTIFLTSCNLSDFIICSFIISYHLIKKVFSINHKTVIFFFLIWKKVLIVTNSLCIVFKRQNKKSV